LFIYGLKKRGHVETWGGRVEATIKLFCLKGLCPCVRSRGSWFTTQMGGKTKESRLPIYPSITWSTEHISYHVTTISNCRSLYINNLPENTFCHFKRFIVVRTLDISSTYQLQKVSDASNHLVYMSLVYKPGLSGVDVWINRYK
jgi:hypothetical protein